MPNLRRDAKYLTAEDKARYVNAVITLKNTIRPGGTISIYDEIAVMHRAVSHLLYLKQIQMVAHAASDFCSWHRQHLHWFETELQRVDPGVTLVYWDWMNADSTNAVFSNDFMGEWRNGSLTGVFAGLVQAIPNSGLVSRDFGELRPENLKDLFTNGGYQKLMEIETFEEFTTQLQLIHNIPHLNFGGDMADLDNAGNDPLFFLHHANTDRLWDEWQRYHGTKPSDFQQYIMEQFTGVFPRPSKYGTFAEDYMWPWDHGKACFVIESDIIKDALSAVIKKFSTEDPVTVIEKWSLKPFIGYEVERDELELGKKLAFDPTYMEAALYPFTVPKELSRATFRINTFGDPHVILQLYGPALCENCYGALAAQDDGAGDEGPQIQQTLVAGRYNLVVYPEGPYLDVAKYEVLVTPLLGPGEKLPPHRPIHPPSRGHGPVPPHIPLKHKLDPSSFVPVQIRPVPLKLNITEQVNTTGHGLSDYFSFIITAPGLATIELKHVALTNVVLFEGFPQSKYITSASTAKKEIILRHSLPRAGTYVVQVYNTSFSVGRYTILVKHKTA